MLELLTLLGIIFAPVYTLGALLFYYHHPILGVIAFIFAILHSLSSDE